MFQAVGRRGRSAALPEVEAAEPPARARNRGRPGVSPRPPAAAGGHSIFIRIFMAYPRGVSLPQRAQADYEVTFKMPYRKGEYPLW